MINNYPKFWLPVYLFKRFLALVYTLISGIGILPVFQASTILAPQHYKKSKDRAWLSKRENILFALLIVVHLLPLWLFKYFPSQDGPSHIYNSNVLHEYFFPERSLFREYFVINHQLVPNWFIHTVLAALMYIVPPLIAAKIVLSGYVILLPVSLRYALNAIRPDTHLSFLAFPFIYNYMVHMGFYNFSYSLPMFLFVIGFWLKHQKQFTLDNTVKLCILSLLLYFCHLISVVTACVAIAILTVWFVLFEFLQLRQQEFNFRSFWQVLSKRALLPLCAFLPTFILVALFTLHKDKAGVEENIYHVPVWKQALKLLTINSLASYDKLELVVSTALGVLFVALFAYFLTKKIRQRQIQVWDGLLFVVAAYVVIYFIAPNAMFGGGKVVPINLRLIFYPFFILTLWLGAQSYQKLMQWRIQVIAVGIALILLGFHTIKYAQLNDYMEEYVSGMNAIEPNTTIIAHCLDPEECLPGKRDLSWRVGPFSLASGYIATQRHLVDLTDYEAAVDYFPIMFRPSLNPYKDPAKTSADYVIDYFQGIGRNVDYVIVWGSRQANREDEVNKSVFRRLQQGYDLIYTSPQRGLMQIYRHHN